jgi:site-specific DNA-cytosine methylase
MFEVIRNTKPEWVIAENVRGLVTWNDGLVLETVCADLEAEGYEVQPFIIPAVAVGAPHRSDRVWIIGHRNTPTASESVMDLAKFKARMEKYPNGTTMPNLATQVDSLIGRYIRMPTPDHNDGARGAAKVHTTRTPRARARHEPSIP